MNKLINWFKNLDQKWKILIVSLATMLFSVYALMLISILIMGLSNGLIVFFTIILSCLAAFFSIKLFSFLPKKRAISIIATSIAFGLIMMLCFQILFNDSCDSNKEGCEICGEPVFAGKLCEKHFNNFAEDYYD